MLCAGDPVGVYQVDPVFRASVFVLKFHYEVSPVFGEGGRASVCLGDVVFDRDDWHALLVADGHPVAFVLYAAEFAFTEGVGVDVSRVSGSAPVLGVSSLGSSVRSRAFVFASNMG